MRNLRLAALLLFLPAFLIPAASDARVFWRWGRWQVGPFFEYKWLGETAYRAPLRINNGRGEMTVVKARCNLDAALRNARKAAGQSGKLLAVLEGSDMALAVVSAEKRVIRILLFPLPRGDECLAFILDQSENDARASDAPPARHMIEEIPAYPGSVPVSYMLNEDTRSAIEVSSTRADPASVQNYYETSLSGAGWTPVLPPCGSGAIYLRGREICLVMARCRPDCPGETTITVLQKRTAME